MPALVFEIAFAGIQTSKRQKSGVTLKFPRILRWRRDKATSEADTLDCLLKLLENDDKAKPLSAQPNKSVSSF
jgi:DNA ligase-1